MGTILVVDDDDFFRSVVAGVLRSAGFKVEEAGTVETALQALSVESAETVICDIVMPVLTGLDRLRILRSGNLDIPVVLLTGSPSLDTAIEAIRKGAFGYLAKSADMADVVETMERAVQLGRAVTELSFDVVSQATLGPGPIWVFVRAEVRLPAR